MSHAGDIRFMSCGDPLERNVRYVLEHIYGLSAGRVDAILMDQRRRILLRSDEAGKLAGFVVWSDYKPQLLLPQNAFSSEEDKQLVSSDGLAVYSFEQIWWRDEQYDLRRIVTELFAAMSEVLSAEARRHALLGMLDDGPQTAQVRDLLAQLGFRPRPNAFSDFRVPLAALSMADVEVEARVDGFELRPFSRPPDPREMANTFNRVFAGGRSEIDAEHVQRMWASPSFHPELSMWWNCDGQVAAFGWVHGRASQAADVQLIGTANEHRRKGLIHRALPVFVRTCEDHGVSLVTFSIEESNVAPLALAETLGVCPWQTRRMMMRAR